MRQERPSASYQTHYEPKPNRAAAGANIFASIIISLVKNNLKIDRTFQTVVITFRRMVIVNNLQRPSNAYSEWYVQQKHLKF